MRKILMSLVVVSVVTGGCWNKKEPGTDYSITSDVTRRKNPPPILINPVEKNVDGVLGFQLGAADFITSTDQDNVVRSAVNYALQIREWTNNTEVRVGNGKQRTDTSEVKALEKALGDHGFTVTVIPQATEG